MKKISDLLLNIKIESIKGSTDIAINKLEFDSRKLVANDVFIAIRGTVSNGHDFIEKAISLGAAIIVCDTLPTEINDKITYIQVQDTNSAMAFMASNYFESPSNKLKLVGITGTNGKTTATAPKLIAFSIKS